MLENTPLRSSYLGKMVFSFPLSFSNSEMTGLDKSDDFIHSQGQSKARLTKTNQPIKQTKNPTGSEHKKSVQRAAASKSDATKHF